MVQKDPGGGRSGSGTTDNGGDGGSGTGGSGGSGTGGSGGSVTGGMAGSGGVVAGGSGGVATGGSAGSGGGGGLGAVAGYSPGFEACVVAASEDLSERADFFVMLDKSISMAVHRVPEPQGPTRWEVVTTALQSFFRSTEAAGLRVGIQYFPLPPREVTEVVSCEVDDYATPDVQIAALPENAQALVDSIDAQELGNLTPAYAAMQGALIHAREWASDHRDRPTAVLYITDGFPTVCQPMSIPALVDLAEEYAYPAASPRIPTFVVGLGIGPDNALAPNLDHIAESGGTERAHLLYGEDAIDALVATLRAITASPIGCELSLERIPFPPDGMAIRWSEIEMLFTPTGGMPELIMQVDDGSGCAAGPGGWYFDDPVDPMKFVICPETCAFLGTGVTEVRFGCSILL